MIGGYPSIEFVDFLESIGISYLLRLSSNDYKKEHKDMNVQDETVTLLHTSSHLATIPKRHPARYVHMKEKEKTKTSILTATLPLGLELALMTNLSFEYNTLEIQDLYYQRWETEKKYDTLKNKMKFESVTGKATVYVYQDFRAQVLVYNMIQDVRRSTNINVRKQSKENSSKYLMCTNENITIGLFKEEMIKILLE